MRWKALFSLYKYVRGKENIKKKIKFKTRRYPPAIQELADFEKDMLSAIDKIRSRKIKSNYQKQLSTGVKKNNKNNKNTG